MNFAYISNTNTSRCPGPASNSTGPQCSFNAQGTYSCQSYQSSHPYQFYQSQSSDNNPCPCKSYKENFTNFTESVTSVKKSLANMYESAKSSKR